jgi:hypothetical protein
MTARAWTGALLLVLALGLEGRAMAQEEPERKALARDLAHLMLDDTLRRELNEQVTGGLTLAVASTLQTKLGRRLLDVEWRILSEIVGRFVADTLVPSRTDELAGEVYARRFDEAELRELLAFQRSPVGRKAARLTPLIAIETAQAINEEIRISPALPRLVDELERAFPVLKNPESP